MWTVGHGTQLGMCVRHWPIGHVGACTVGQGTQLIDWVCGHWSTGHVAGWTVGHGTQLIDWVCGHWPTGHVWGWTVGHGGADGSAAALANACGSPPPPPHAMLGQIPTLGHGAAPLTTEAFGQQAATGQVTL